MAKGKYKPPKRKKRVVKSKATKVSPASTTTTRYTGNAKTVGSGSKKRKLPGGVSKKYTPAKTYPKMKYKVKSKDYRKRTKSGRRRG